MQQNFMPVVEKEWKASDGTVLLAKSWTPANRARALVVAMHGLNCSVDDWLPLAGALQRRDIALMAWNLRGQGLDPVEGRRGAWLDVEGMTADLAQLLDESEGGEAPIFLAGESMGALLALRASTDAAIAARISGTLLLVPVVALAQRNPPWIKRAMKRLSDVMPGLRLNPSWFVHGSAKTPMLTRDAKRQAAFEGAPYRIHRQTVGFLVNMGDLIDSAYDTAGKLTTPVAIFSAGQDAFVPINAIEECFRRIPRGDKAHYHYPESYHQLLHDLDASRVIGDAVTWIEKRL